jgi:AbrB family looped-hinge helix DNA binding protein
MPSVKVNAKNRITLPSAVVEGLNIQKGDYLLMDMQDGMAVLMPCPKWYADHLQSLHSDIWEGVDVQKYLNREREAWEKAGDN